VSRVTWKFLFAALVVVAAPSLAAEPPAGFAKRIADATAAIAADPDNKDLYARRAELYTAAGDNARAIADYEGVIKLDPRAAEAYEQRGSLHFMLGHIAESIADFDAYIELRPDQEPWHWKRGISYYYAGLWEKGRRQFSGYQTVDDSDVENAVWHFLCTARGQGVEAARRELLKIKDDPRVPMMEVYALYGGHAKAEDVLAAATAGTPSEADKNSRLFYAHLYLGLYYEVGGDGARAAEHIGKAQSHKIGHYMWNVADVHARRLREAAAKP
jgi:lipoprotein NlpI